MSYRYSYALEKFDRVIYSLACGKDKIQKRLLMAFQGDLLMITPEHLPIKAQEDYKWVMKSITKYDEPYKGYNKYFETIDGRYDHLLKTNIEATLCRIRGTTGTQIAQKIFNIWNILHEDASSKK